MYHHYSLQNPMRLTLLFLGAAQLVLFFPVNVHAQPYSPPGNPIVSCSSDGGRVFCDADTRGGVRLTRQYQDSGACVQGQSWGYTDRAVWVDRGCAGEFALSPVAQAASTIQPGTLMTVRTNEPIDADRYNGRIYRAVVDQDIWAANGQLAVPRGSTVELMVRQAPDRDLMLDLESVTVNGQRYALAAQPERIESQKRPGVGENRSTAEHVGGGAILGAIVGAIAGGGKGAAIGAGAGAVVGAGVQTATRGREVHVPAETVLTFRLEQPLTVGVPDTGVDRDGYHYHDYDRPRG